VSLKIIHPLQAISNGIFLIVLYQLTFRASRVPSATAELLITDVDGDAVLWRL